MELCAVNHWPVAVETHQRNHPDARHYCVDLASARPMELVPEGRLDLLLASPTCTFHSRARGGRPIHDQQRMDPWHIVTWCTELRVRRLLIENVPEFVEWGPVSLKTGRPLKSRRGEYFQAWVRALEGLGFRCEWRIVNAADHGDATTRRRFFLMACSDGRRIRWPEPTHSREGGVDMFGNRTMRWRAAREVIDWSIPGTSIFRRERPLAPKTLQRIAAGLVKFCGPAAEPFLVVLRNHCDARSIDCPLPTVTAGGNHVPHVEPFVIGQQSGAVARSIAEPVPTIATEGAISIVRPFIAHVNHGDRRGTHARIGSVRDPLPTVTTSRGIGLVEPHLTSYYGNGGATSVDRPAPTITTKDRLALIEPFIVPQFGERDGQRPRTHSVDRPLPAATGHGAGALVEPVIDPLVEIAGRPYAIDIRFRMLQNHELAAAMSFDADDVGYEFVGTKGEITKQIGNAVPVRTATALVAALMER